MKEVKSTFVSDFKRFASEFMTGANITLMVVSKNLQTNQVTILGAHDGISNEIDDNMIEVEDNYIEPSNTIEIPIHDSFKLDFTEFDEVTVGHCTLHKEDLVPGDDLLITLLKSYMYYNRLENLNIRLTK